MLGICPPSSTKVFLPPSRSPPKRLQPLQEEHGGHPGNKLIAGLLREGIISTVLVLNRSSSLWGLSYFPCNEKCKCYLGPVFPLSYLCSSH